MTPKCNVLTAALFTTFYIRQLCYERRLSNRQGRWKREAERAMKQHGRDLIKEVSSILTRWQKEIEKALRVRGDERA